VREVYVDQLKNEMTRIRIASFGSSKEEAIDHLKEIHRLWKGERIERIDWVASSEDGRIGEHNTVLHHSDAAQDSSIEVSIVRNIGTGGWKGKWRVLFIRKHYGPAGPSRFFSGSFSPIGEEGGSKKRK